MHASVRWKRRFLQSVTLTENLDAALFGPQYRHKQHILECTLIEKGLAEMAFLSKATTFVELDSSNIAADHLQENTIQI